MGGRLHELKRRMKGEKLSDGLTLSGKGRLPDKTIDILQSYYGWAVREYVSDLQGMARGIWAGLMHRCSTDDNPQHQFCPSGPDSWCKFQQVIAGARETYVHHNSIPKAVFEVIKPTYLQLTERSLLERCLMGATQNTNESFNNVLWSMCPKEGFCSRDNVETATGLAVLTFNHGAVSLLAVLKEFGCLDGRYTRAACEAKDLLRIKKGQRKASTKEKERRKKRRRHRKGWEESVVEQEGVTYASEQF